MDVFEKLLLILLLAQLLVPKTLPVKELKFFEAPLNPNWINTEELPRFKYDGTIRSSRVDGGKSITVRKPEQAHILGSKEDIEGFTQYSKNK